MDFIIDILKENQIRIYWERQWYRESFYLLAMVDYLSRENGLPLCNDYEDIRNCTLSEPLYPWKAFKSAVVQRNRKKNGRRAGNQRVRSEKALEGESRWSVKWKFFLPHGRI